MKHIIFQHFQYRHVCYFSYVRRMILLLITPVFNRGIFLKIMLMWMIYYRYYPKINTVQGESHGPRRKNKTGRWWSRLSSANYRIVMKEYGSMGWKQIIWVILQKTTLTQPNVSWFRFRAKLRISSDSKLVLPHWTTRNLDESCPMKTKFRNCLDSPL
jgi:hypothetical protein